MFSLHTHDGKSSASRGFTDSSIKLRDMIIRAKEIGLEGIAITNHECIGSFIEAKNLEEELDFPIICGNEIYLVSDNQYEALRNNYQSGMYFPHFLLLALDEIGNQQLRELSTIAWEFNSFTQSGLIRTPTKMSDIEEVISDNKGHIVASTACMGGQVGKWILDILNEEISLEDKNIKEQWLRFFIGWCIDMFGKDNFYLECQPASEEQKEQLLINDYILKLSKELNVPYIITTDAHYLKKELLPLHSAFLNSSDDSDREVEAFYKTAYLMNKEEVIGYFTPYWEMEDILKGIENTKIIGSKAKRYGMHKKQVIPKIKFDNKWEVRDDFFPNKEYIQKMINSEYEQDKYLMYKIQQGMKKLIPMQDYSETFDRIEQEVTEFWYVSEQINDRLGAYFVTVNKLVEIMWTEGDSLVGVGRGSGVSSVIDYLLEVTQINPLKMPVEMPFYRFIDRARVELPDIDIDSQSDRRKQIFLAIKRYFEKLGGDVVNCCTYGTIGSKSAISTACRGLGFSSDIAQEISNLIPVERGFNWSLDDCYYGNEKKKRQPLKEFIKIINSYEGLWETAKLIEGCIVSRGTHASGVFITNDKFTNYNAKMRSPDGTLISQWDLHESEQFGLIKYDFLTISALTKIRYTLDFLIENGHIEKKSSLKETYNSVLNPHNIVFDKPEIWQLIEKNEVIDLFQFDSQVAVQTVSNIKPHSLIELAQSNSLMRLQTQEGKTESPTEMYVRYKKNVFEWYKDMEKWNVPKKDQDFLYEHLKQYNFVCDTQESMMALVRLDDLTNFTIKEAHEIRGVIAKKKMDKIPQMKEFFIKKGLNNGVDESTLIYLWENQFMLQAGYAFSILHTMAYTFIALQELILYSNYPSIYWNCACLTVNSGSTDDEDNDFDFQDEIVKKKKATDYGKLATAISTIIKRGTTVSTPHINKANFGFYPDEENNEIIFGLKGVSGIGEDVAYEIINNRPYSSLEDFHKKVVETKKEIILSTGKKQNKSLVPLGSAISLIKAGSFDKLETDKDRIDIMKDYLKLNFPNKKTLDLRAVESVVELGIVPEQHKLAIRVNGFRNYIVNDKNFIKNDEESKTKKWYILKGHNESATQKTVAFFEEYFISNMSEGKDFYYDENGDVIFACKLKSTGFEKTFELLTKDLKQWLKSDECLQKYNEFKFSEIWNKYAKGSISKWEMDSLSFYYHEHELANINKEKYFVKNFSELNEKPDIERFGKYRGREYPMFKLDRIVGTVLDKNKTKHMVTLLTVNGEVVTLKFYSGQFGFYDKTISEQNSDGSKTTIEESWFKRGNLLLVSGYRNGEMFKAKKYKDSAFQHTIALIEEIREDGVLMLKTDRAKI